MHKNIKYHILMWHIILALTSQPSNINVSVLHKAFCQNSPEDVVSAIVVEKYF